jgi:hypothetical protein
LENYAEAFKHSSKSNMSVTNISELGDGSCIHPDILKEPVAKVFLPPPPEDNNSNSYSMKKMVEFKDNDDELEEEETKQEEQLLSPEHGILEQSLEEERTQNDYQQSWTNWSQRQQRYECHLQWFRILVVVASTLLIVSTLLFCMNGIWNLELQTRSVLEGWNQVQETATVMQEFLRDLEDLQSSVLQQTWNLWQLLDQHCPKLKPSGVCPANNCNVTDLPLQFTWEEWLDFVQPTNVAILYQGENWTLLQNDLDTLLEQPVESNLEYWHWALWVTCACNCLLALLAFFIMWGISLPWLEKSLERSLSSCLFGFFYWLLVVLAWVFGMGFLIASVLSVDVCADSPNEIAVELLNNRMDTQSFLPKYWEYHMRGCPADSYPPYVDDRVWLWANLLPPTSRLADGLEGLPSATFEETCGTSIEPLRNAAATLNLQLCIVTQSLVRSLRLSSLLFFL